MIVALDTVTPEQANQYNVKEGTKLLTYDFVLVTDEDTKKNAYISHGWSAARISSEFQPGNGKELRSYVRMQQEGKDVLGGTVFVLCGDKIVGSWEGVSFKSIPRRVLNIFLPPPKPIRS